MRSWAKRTATAALATAALAGAAIAGIDPGSESWARVMDIKLRAKELQVRVGEAVGRTEDSAARAALLEASAGANEIFRRCEELLDAK